MAGQLRKEKRAHHPADPARIGGMMLSKTLGAPPREIGVGAKQDKPRHCGHSNIDTGEARFGQMRVHDIEQSEF